MIAAKLRPYYAAQAKQRMEKNRPKEGAEKIPEVKKADSRDEAGKVAGIISEPSEKNIIHSEEARVCNPPIVKMF